MNKKVLITGSTDGIGKLTAYKLAKRGYEVYLHGRNEAKLNDILKEIQQESGNGNVHGFVADFSNPDSVKEMAKQVKKELPLLDVLINNAGVYHSTEALNKDGLDMRFVVNHLAPVLFTNELMPLLEKSTDPRIINLSSAAQSSVSMEALKGNENISVSDAYAQSKLALTIWSFYMAEKRKDMIVIPVNPGSLLNTKMVKEAFGNSWSTVDKGSDILIELSLSEAMKDASGKYFDYDRGTFGMAHPDAYDARIVKELIELTSELLLQ